MENIDFRPPIIKNIGAAFASATTLLAAIFLLLSAVVGLLSLPIQPALIAAYGSLTLGAMLLFGLYSAGKDRRGMRRGALLWLSVLSIVLLLIDLAAIGAYFFLPSPFSTDLIAEALTAARVGAPYHKWYLLIALGLVALSLLGFGLFFGTVRRTLKDGIPRRRGTGLLCLVSVIASLAVCYPAVMYTLGREFSSVIRFSDLISYNFISALSPLFCFVGICLLYITLLKYSRAVKRSSNV